MTPYQAILAAADHIETNPAEFDFWVAKQPRRLHCGTPGCALGWVAFFAELRPYKKEFSTRGISRFLGGHLPGDDKDEIFDDVFYARMDDLCGKSIEEWSRWKYEAPVCADTLRKYAQKYHAPEQQPLESRVERAEEAVTND